MSTRPVLTPDNLVEKHGAQIVGKAPWSTAAKVQQERAIKQLASPPPIQSAKGRRTRRHRHRRGGKKAKYTRRR